MTPFEAILVRWGDVHGNLFLRVEEFCAFLFVKIILLVLQQKIKHQGPHLQDQDHQLRGRIEILCFGDFHLYFEHFFKPWMPHLQHFPYSCYELFLQLDFHVELDSMACLEIHLEDFCLSFHFCWWLFQFLYETSILRYHLPIYSQSFSLH